MIGKEGEKVGDLVRRSLRVLVIDPAVKADIAAVVRHAEANRVSLDRLTRMAARPPLEPPVGDLPGYSVQVPNGYRCVFSIEEQPTGWWRHLSVSVGGSPRHLPSPESVAMLVREFGFAEAAATALVRRQSDPTHPVALWIEEERAVNVAMSL